MRQAFDPRSFFVLQALSSELALMFMPQPRGEFVVRPAITVHDTLTHSTGLTIGSMDVGYWGQSGHGTRALAVR